MAFQVPRSPSSLSLISNSINSGITQGVSASGFIGTAGGYLINRYGPALIGAAQTRLDGVASNVISNIAGNSTNGGSSGNNSGNGRNGPTPPGRSNKGNYRPKRGGVPTLGGSPDSKGVPQFSINTGINSGTVINPLQKTTNYYSPLYIQCGSLFPDDDIQSDSEFSKSLNSVLFFKYNITVQSDVNSSLAREFTQASFYRYLSTLTYALQLYYMIDSILAYTSHSPNENLAMTRLRMGITPDISNGHINLRSILESCSIPPNLLEYIRYMYQNYSFNNVSGSSIIRLSLDDILCTSEYGGNLGIDGTAYSTLIESLIGQSEVSSIIRKIRPNWRKPMPPSSYEALFDPQFSTFWHNSNISYEDFGSNTVKFTINAQNTFDPIYYAIFDNRLDGIIYASCSVTDANGINQMGLWKPFSTFADRNSINSSLLHYSNDDFTRPVTDVSHRNASVVFAAPHVEITSDKNPIWKVNYSNFAGSCIPQVHTLDNVRQAFSLSIIWLLGLD